MLHFAFFQFYHFDLKENKKSWAGTTALGIGCGTGRAPDLAEPSGTRTLITRTRTGTSTGGTGWPSPVVPATTHSRARHPAPGRSPHAPPHSAAWPNSLLAISRATRLPPRTHSLDQAAHARAGSRTCPLDPTRAVAPALLVNASTLASERSTRACPGCRPALGLARLALRACPPLAHVALADFQRWGPPSVARAHC